MAENMEEQADEVENSEISELQRVRVRNIQLDQEILALSNRIRLLDLSLLPGYQEQTVDELRQVEQKLLDTSEACSSLTSQCELSDQKTEELELELELELLRQSQEIQDQSGLQEKLAQEKARLAEAEEKIAELQQKLKESHHQMQLCETHILERKQLEEEVKELREKETKAQRQLEEEQQKRKFLDQRSEELHQKLRLQQEKEVQLVKTCVELQAQGQQQEDRLRVLEEEKKTLLNEHLHCQTHSQKLLEQIITLQREKEALFKELVHILKRVDIAVRKHHEQRLQHKAKLRRAKEIFISELKQRDVSIRHLENKLRLSKRQLEKMSTVNGELVQERSKLREQLHDLQEAERSNKELLGTIQSRVQFLDEENKQHHERRLQLATQVGDLKRALRKIHRQDLDEMKSIGFAECQLQNKILPLSNASFSLADLSESRSSLKAIQGDSAGKAQLSSMLFPSSEISYLNMASSAGDPVDHKGQLREIFLSGHS
ncbi:coiled-coil domain-containing protein 30-like isoform X2 [Sceloporus undulatus]|uniref:coiled-coil domain-containing protein 30-like isoform X2 n=1 Tax=Sceloporus undulatus TaxID=8520 RepID=UPI001C4AC385|nr:coiled-coil domain-containing protein 30-like isoform X2 [Sceloporus undulatus]XP_042334192.1 coiled-coil domain-containing protein 30-like isoform X2 [Sceloporus undulatus]XP_042334193.1 coiled-coil domain-containing protein 30-like isoform X2 [Sceloporus undulatus]XP_042334194.1 coiled-coil domain-containing protein 30-like isoform X2 [Sceloporus undulatus]